MSNSLQGTPRAGTCGHICAQCLTQIHAETSILVIPTSQRTELRLLS